MDYKGMKYMKLIRTFTKGDLLDSDTILLVDPAGTLNKKMLNCF